MKRSLQIDNVICNIHNRTLSCTEFTLAQILHLPAISFVIMKIPNPIDYFITFHNFTYQGLLGFNFIQFQTWDFVCPLNIYYQALHRKRRNLLDMSISKGLHIALSVNVYIQYMRNTLWASCEHKNTHQRHIKPGLVKIHVWLINSASLSVVVQS